MVELLAETEFENIVFSNFWDLSSAFLRNSVFAPLGVLGGSQLGEEFIGEFFLVGVF